MTRALYMLPRLDYNADKPSYWQRPRTIMLNVSEISGDQQELMRFLPEAGPVGNKNLRQQLKWDTEHYFRIRNELIEMGLLTKGPGQGGSVFRAATMGTGQTEADADTSPQALANHVITQYKKERELYPKVKQVLETQWKQDEGLQNVLVEITASQGARATGGKWSRPDITVVAVQVYDLLPTKYLDVITFEVKPEGSWDVAGVFEAASHSRAATRSFLAIHVPRSDPPLVDAMERLIEECERFGIGLMTFKNPADFDTYETHVEPERKTPSPYLLNQFLTTQLTEEARRQIALSIR